MKFLFISNEGKTADLAFSLKRKGHDVLFWIRKHKKKAIFDGLLKKPEHWGPHVSKDRVVVFDEVGGGQMADRLRKQGIPVFGGGHLNDLLADQVVALTIAKQLGFNVPDVREFPDFLSAIVFLDEDRGELGDVVWQDLRCSPGELGRILRWLKPEGKVVIQRALEGEEISCEGWFGRKGWTRELLLSRGRETGKLGEGFLQEALEKFEGVLKEPEEGLPFIGPLGVHFTGNTFTHFVPSFNNYAPLLQLCKSDIGEAIHSLALGKTTSLPMSDEVAYSYQLTLPLSERDLCGFPLNLPATYKSLFHLQEVKVDEEGQLVCAGNSGKVVTLVGERKKVEEALLATKLTPRGWNQ